MKKIYFAVAFGMLATAMLTTSCVKDDFADPAPYSDTTSLKANTTIADLKAKYPGKMMLIDNNLFAGIDSVIIEGVVISDDKEGNFYKSIFIQDATGGIEVKLSKTGIYNNFKRGQRLLVVCKGLFMGDYGGQVQLGSTFTENGVTQIGGLETDYIISKYVYKKGKTLVPVTPKRLFDPSAPTIDDVCSLIQIDDVEFKTLNSPIDGKVLTYADALTKTTLNHPLKKNGADLLAGGKVLVLRTSGYSKFAGDTLPSVKCSMVGVLSYYNGTFQLLIRDTKDVKR